MAACLYLDLPCLCRAFTLLPCLYLVYLAFTVTLPLLDFILPLPFLYLAFTMHLPYLYLAFTLPLHCLEAFTLP